MASVLRSRQTFWEPATDATAAALRALAAHPSLPAVARRLAPGTPAARWSGPNHHLDCRHWSGAVDLSSSTCVAHRGSIASHQPFEWRGSLRRGVRRPERAVRAQRPGSSRCTFADLFHTVGRLPQATLSTVPAGALGMLFDQEYGIAAYAPVLLLGFVGLAGMLRDPSRRWLGAGLSAAALALILLPATVDPWWSKSMMPGRPVFLLLPVLGVPIAWLYERLAPGSPGRAGAQVLLLISAAITLTIVMLSPSVPAVQDGDGSSALLVWMSPAWQLWREAPSYVAGVTRASTIRVLLWLLAFAVVAWLLARRQASSDGRAALAAALSHGRGIHRCRHHECRTCAGRYDAF